MLLRNPNQIAALCYLSATVEQDRKYFVLLFCGTENSPTTNVNFYIGLEIKSCTLHS